MLPRTLISLLLAASLAAACPLACYAQTEIKDQVNETVNLEGCKDAGTVVESFPVEPSTEYGEGASTDTRPEEEKEVSSTDYNCNSGYSDGSSNDNLEVSDELDEYGISAQALPVILGFTIAEWGTIFGTATAGVGLIDALMQLFGTNDSGSVPLDTTIEKRATVATATYASGIYDILYKSLIVQDVYYDDGSSAKGNSIFQFTEIGTGKIVNYKLSRSSMLFPVVNILHNITTKLSIIDSNGTRLTAAQLLHLIFSETNSSKIQLYQVNANLTSMLASANVTINHLNDIKQSLIDGGNSITNSFSVICSMFSEFIELYYGNTSFNGNGKTLLDNIADIASAFSGTESLLGSLLNIESLLSGLNIGTGGITYDEMRDLLIGTQNRGLDEHSIYGYLKTIHEWTDDYQETLFNNVSRYLFEANDEQSTTLTAYVRMIYQLLNGKQFNIYDGLLDKLDAIYDALSNWEPAEYPDGLDGITARLDAIIGLLALDTAVDILDAILGNLDFPNFAAALSRLGDTLASAFPFCLIFAVIAALSALAADPVAPAFDWNIPIGLNGETYNLVFDLTDYDGLAVMVRGLLFVAYCIGLFMVTKDHIHNPAGGDT